MSAILPAGATPWRERRALVSSRAVALATDAFLVAYALWCAGFLEARLAGEAAREGWLAAPTGFVGRRPWLLLLGPLVAVLWQTTGDSLGLRLARVRLVDAAGGPVEAGRRAFRGLLGLLEALVALFPAALGVLRWHAGGDGALLLVLSGLLAATFAAAGLVDERGRGFPDRLAGTRTVLGPLRATGPRRAAWRRVTPWAGLVLLLLTFAVGGTVTELSLGSLLEGAGRAGHFLGRLFSPDWSIASTVLEKMVETVYLALIASAFALPFAFVLGFLGARNLMRGTLRGRAVYGLVRTLMNVVRSIEPLVWVIIFTLWVGIGPFAGCLALFVHSVAALGKLYSEAVESIDPGPVEAIRATGANALQTLRYGVVPQVLPPFLAFTIYRWDINVRMATILGLVGGGGIGFLLINYQQLARWEKVGTIILAITIVVWLMDWASSKARERL